MSKCLAHSQSSTPNGAAAQIPRPHHSRPQMPVVRAACTVEASRPRASPHLDQVALYLQASLFAQVAVTRKQGNLPPLPACGWTADFNSQGRTCSLFTGPSLPGSISVATHGLCLHVRFETRDSRDLWHLAARGGSYEVCDRAALKIKTPAS